MKLNHKEKVAKARKLRNKIEASSYFINPETKEVIRKKITPIFQSHKWEEVKLAKALKLREKIKTRREAKLVATK